MRFILPLLCVAALSITVRGQASPVENKKASPAQQFIDAAQRIAGDGSAKVLKDAAQYLNPHIASEKGRGVTPGSNLASSSFASSNGGWSVTTSDGVVSNAQVSGGSITAKFAQGGKTLYFTSPASWPSDIAGAYNGKLSFMTNPAEYASAPHLGQHTLQRSFVQTTLNHSTGTPSARCSNFTCRYTGSFISATGHQSNPSGSSLYDVALVAQCGYALTYSGLFTATSSSSYSVTLNEDSGWVDSRTGRRPTIFDFLGTLSNLKSVQIRAYAYSGPGTGALYSASIQAGIKWNPCCTTDDTVDICANPGSPYYNPPQLRFYCAGSQAFVTRVTSVSPKFARQTGGATVTVYGENFGYPGSPATVRIGGLACQQTSYTSDTITTGNLGPVNHNRLVCTTPVSRGFDHSVTVTAQSSSLASPYSVRENAMRTRWEYLGTDATSCSSDDTHGFQFGAHDFSLVTELTNLVGDTDIHLATDYNTGDVYAFGRIKASVNFETLGKHISLGDKNSLTAPAHDFSAFLLKSNKQGVPQWVAHITGTLSALQPAGIQVDASTAPPSIYIAASMASANAASPSFCPGKYVANSLAAVTCDVVLKRRPDLSAPAAIGDVKAFLAKYTGNGAVSWASPILHTGGTFSELSLSAFRPSTSRIINYQTQSDNPSAVPVKPYLKDNGGVFLAGTILTGGTVTFGYESQIYSSQPNSAGGQTSTFTAPALAGFVTKYDDDGRVLWARLFTGGNADLTTALAANSKVTDVSAMNDRVYVVGFQAGAMHFQSCQFRTHSGGSGDDLSENRECPTGAANTAALTSGNAAGVFAVAYDASGQVQWIKNYPATAATVAACAAVSSLKTARPLTGNTVAWNNLQTLLGRNQPVFGEPNDVGSEFREVGAAAGRWLYIVGSYAAGNTISLPQNLAYSPIMTQGSFTSAKEPAFPIVSAGTAITLASPTSGSTNAFLIKVDAVTGLTQWGTKYGAPTAITDWLVVPTDVAADPVTGSVYIAGTITNPAVTINCNKNDANSNCGVDLFNMGNVRKIGCPQDPRPVLSIKQCPVDTTPATTCAYGILNKERGLPYCQFVPLKLAASSTSGFIAAISEVWTDEFGRTVAIGYSSDTTAGVTNVAWFKALGNGHGHTQNTAPASIATSKGSKLAIHDTDVIVSGSYSGHPSSPTATLPSLQFPGVHALYQDNVLLPAAQQANEGLYSTASAGTGGFLAWLVD